MLGVRTGSIPRFERRNRGEEADMKVGKAEWRKVTGAIESGRIQLERDWRAESSERGGWVDGVSISFVRAMSKGANNKPAIPAAPAAAAKLDSGEEEERMSRPPVADVSIGERP